MNENKSLEQILKHVHPLPWRVSGGEFGEAHIIGEGGLVLAEFYHANNLDYAIRAANTLPELLAWRDRLLTVASDRVQFDAENMVPICRSCNVELDDNGNGHLPNCLAHIIISECPKEPPQPATDKV